MTRWPEMPATVAPVPGRYTGDADMTNDEAMAILIGKAIQFANLAAGEGISIEGLEPETFLCDYSTATGDDEWETLADRTATAMRAELEAARAEEASWRMASQEAEHEVAAVRAQRDAAEAKLAKAVEVLREISETPARRFQRKAATQALEQLKGQSDE